LTAPKQNPGPELFRERDGQFVQLAHDEPSDDWPERSVERPIELTIGAIK
jgi:hypothetical protein